MLNIVYETLTGATAVLIGDTVVIDRTHAATACAGVCIAALLSAAGRRSELDELADTAPLEAQPQVDARS